MTSMKRSVLATSKISKRIKIEDEALTHSISIKKEVDIATYPTIKKEADIVTCPTIKKEVEHVKVEIEQPPNQFEKVDPQDYQIGPQNWHKIYNEIVDMRSKFYAPVDTQGCSTFTTSPNLKTENPKVYRFQLLISLMLSSQTKDEVNHATMLKLNHVLGELNLDTMSKLNEIEIDSLINKVGFHNRKSKYIKETCKLLREKFEGDIPKTIEELISLPGVGPKMGYLLLQCGWNINSGIGVDVHLHRLSLLWKWCKNKQPEKARLELEEWLPSKYWTEVNPLMVGFGQVICVPRAPNCDICTLGKKGLCKAGNKKLINQPMTDSRMEKLQKQRGDLTRLIEIL